MLAGDKVAPACARDRKLSLACQAHKCHQLSCICASAAAAQASLIGEIVCMLNHCSSSSTSMLKMQPSTILLRQ